MKKSISVIIAVLGAGVMAAQAGLITVTNVTDNQQGDLRTTTSGTTYNTAGTSTSIGNMRVGELAGALSRPEIKFNYANPLGAGESVQSAVLWLYLTANTLAASGNGSQVLVYASQTRSGTTVIAAGDFENAAFSQVGTWTALTSASATGQWVSFDVTSVVTNDIAKDTTLASVFRLQLNNDTSMLNAAPIQGLIFTDNSVAGGNIPQLVITTIPEPATIGMLGLGAIITLLFRKLRVQ